MFARLIDLAIEIQQIPAPTFAEERRAAFVRRLFANEGLQVTSDALGNVYASIPGQTSEKPVVVSAHLDTVFPAGAPLTIRRERGRLIGPGIGDNSVAIAALFWLAWQFSAKSITPKRDVWLVANVGEEGLGNLRGMYEVIKRFGRSPKGYLVLEGIGLGWIYNRGLGVRRYQVQVSTAGGHAWGARGSPSAIHVLARMVAALTDLPSLKSPAVSLNVGMVEGGVSVNTIAPSAHALLEIRAEKAADLMALASQVEEVCRAARGPRVAVRCELVGERPAGALPKSHPLVQAAESALRGVGVKPSLGIASTDANAALSQGLPAICMGLTEGGNAHSSDEFILINPLKKGLTALTNLVIFLSTT